MTENLQSSSSSNADRVPLNIILDDVALGRVNSIIFLCVIIDKNLTWKNHIDAISKTIPRNAGMLNKAEKNCT